MQISTQRSLLAFVCVLATLLLAPPSHAEDHTNAAKIPGTVWGKMYQVMGGVNTKENTEGSPVRGPSGIYAIVILEGQIQKATGAKSASCTLTPPAGFDTTLISYFSSLLENPAVSGLLVIAQWCRLNPTANSYAWHDLDDAFQAIDNWNKAHLSEPPKTLQLSITPGFYSPAWLFAAPYLTSCDGLFTGASSVPDCGYTGIFYETESGGTPTQMPLPLPWNATYKTQWGTFLTALNKHILTLPASSAFVSIGVAGPTASSDEIILPNENNQPASLNVPGATGPGITVLNAWDMLFANNYGATASFYHDSDRAFIEEWSAAIDLYGSIFQNVTLTLATGKGLPNFVSTASSLVGPPPAFVLDCGAGSKVTMDCAAEAAILAYFAAPAVGGGGLNAKAIQENGLKAPGYNGGALSGSGVKWLAQKTMQGLTAVQGALPGTMPIESRLLGGLQLAVSVSKNEIDMAMEGCTTQACDSTTGGLCTPRSKNCMCTVAGKCTGAPPSKPEDVLLNVLTAYFAGTKFGSYYGETAASNPSVTNAPINYLQIYDVDIIYAAGATATTTKTVGGTHMTAQHLLDNASGQILGSKAGPGTAEPVTLPPACCVGGTVSRNAFVGDDVCVTAGERNRALAENNEAASRYAASSNYTNNSLPVSAQVPYGVCQTGSYWRQSYMGDYVCVSLSQQKQVAHDNSQAQITRTRPACAVAQAVALYDTIDITIQTGDDNADANLEILANLSNTDEGNLCLKPSSDTSLPKGNANINEFGNSCANSSSAPSWNNGEITITNPVKLKTKLTASQVSASSLGITAIQSPCELSCSNWDLQAIKVTFRDSAGKFPAINRPFGDMGTKDWNDKNCMARLKAPPNSTAVLFSLDGSGTHTYVDGKSAGWVTTCKDNGDGGAAP
jgi:hypothetical protein